MPATTILYLGTQSGFVSLAYVGQQWRATPPTLVGKAVTNIAYSAYNPALFYATVTGHGVYRSRDNGLIWQQCFAVNAHTLVLDEINPNRLWVGGQPVSLHTSTNGGDTWRDLSDGLLNLPEALDWSFPHPPYEARLATLKQVPQNPETLLAGIEIGGLLRSIDGGQQWVLSDEDLDDDIHILTVDPKNRQNWVAGTGDGLYYSTDSAVNWLEVTLDITATYITTAVILRNGACLIAVANTPPGNWVENATTQLYHIAENRLNWQEVSLPRPENVSFLANNPQQPKDVYCGTQGGTLYLSQDYGLTWSEIWQGTGAIHTILATRLG